MKKAIFLFLAIVISLPLCACSVDQQYQPLLDRLEANDYQGVKTELAQLYDEFAWEQECLKLYNQYEYLICMLDNGEYDTAIQYLRDTKPQPEDEGIQITMDNQQDYFTIGIQEDYQTDRFGNPEWFFTYGVIRLKEEYLPCVVENKPMDLAFNIHWEGVYVTATADFENKTYQVIYRHDSEEKNEEVSIYCRPDDYGEITMVGGSFAGSGYKEGEGNDATYGNYLVEAYEVLDVVGVLYLTK